MESFFGWRMGWIKNSICFLFTLSISLPASTWFTCIFIILSPCSWFLIFWLCLKDIVISSISSRLIIIGLNLYYVLRRVFNKRSIIKLFIKETCLILTLLLLKIISCRKLFSALYIKLTDLVFFKELLRDLLLLQRLVNWGLVALLFIRGNTAFIHYYCRFYLLLHLFAIKS